MKKHILFVFLFMFLFINGGVEVKAAQGLTCLYEPTVKDRYALIQETDGNLVVLRHDSTKAKIDDEGWRTYLVGDNIKWGDENGKEGVEIIAPGSLNSCPVGMILNKNKYTIFYSEYSEKLSSKIKKLNSDDSLNEAVVLESFSTENLSEVDNPEIYIEKGIKQCSSIDQKWFDDFAQVAVDNGYNASCVYYKNYDNNGCHIIRMAITTEKEFFLEQHEPYIALEKKGSARVGALEWDIDGAIYNNIVTNYGGVCPSSIFVDRQVDPIDSSMTTVVSKVYLTDETLNTEKYIRKSQRGNNLKDGSELTNDVHTNINFDKIEIDDCEDLFGDSPELLDLIKSIINLFKILIPIILIGLGILDFAKAIFAGSEDVMKKAQSKFIKRVLIAVAIFLVPSLLKLVLSIADNIWDVIDPDLCGLL